MAISLSMREASFVSQVIYRINLCDSFEDLSKILLSQIKTLIPFQKGMALEVSSQDNEFVYSNPYFYGPDNEAFDESKFILGNYHSVWWEYIEAPWSTVFRATDSREEKEWVKSPLYRDIYCPQKLYYALQATFVHNDIKLGMIGLYRQKEEGDFSEKEVFFMELLKAHIELKMFRLFTRYNGFKISSVPEVPGYFVPKSFVKNYSLTRREEEIVNMMLSGADNATLVAELCITRSTLDKHIHNIYGKLGVRNRTALFQMIRS